MNKESTYSEQSKGVIFALIAFGIWGVVPVYFKLVSQVSPLEVLANRVLWSCLFLFAYILLTDNFQRTVGIFSQRKIVLELALSATVISINWLVFIYAVGQNRILDTTLGYFINPLVNIVFGMIFFSERARFFQWVSILIALIGVIYQIIYLGYLPWISMVLAMSFSTYSMLRKKIMVDSISGLFIETLWLLPISMVYLLWLQMESKLDLISGPTDIILLLIAAGLVTSLPLLAFASAARRLSLMMVGLLQYIGPSIAFIIAVFCYDEPMNTARLITFIFIWLALLVFSIEGILVQRKKI